MNHDRDLKPRARKLRKNQTTAEGRLWFEPRNRRFVGYKFRRQQPIGPYIADFFCHQAGLVIELDGESHFGQDESESDARTGWSLRV